MGRIRGHGMRLVGIIEIAQMLSVRRGTIDAWRNRGQLPEPEWVVSGTPIWRAETIGAWAASTGRSLT